MIEKCNYFVKNRICEWTWAELLDFAQLFCVTLVYILKNVYDNLSMKNRAAVEKIIESLYLRCIRKRKMHEKQRRNEVKHEGSDRLNFLGR